MRKIKCIIIITMMLLIGCSNSTNEEDNQTTTKGTKQTSQIETTTENASTTENITTEEPTTSTPEPTEAALAIREVLKNERPFLDADNGYKETYRNDYSYFQGNNNANIGWGNFIMLDIGNSVSRGVWITIRNLKYNGGHLDLNDHTSLIFRYYDEQVYGYQCNKIISLDTSEYFTWDSEYLHSENDKKYRGVGKIEFEEEKIKFVYYVWEGDIEAKEWLENLIPDENVEIVEDNEMCLFITEKSKEKYRYNVGNGNLVEDIDKYIY